MHPTQGETDPGRLRADAAERWATTLVEPLMPPERYIAAHDAFRSTCQTSPDWASLFLAGVASDMSRTLPSDDPWRATSARIGSLTAGPRPPATDGAVTASGEPFGVMQNSLDLIDAVFPDPTRDVVLVAVVDPLSPQAAAVLSFSTYGWEHAFRATRAVHAQSLADQTMPDGVSFPQRWRDAAAGTALYDAGTAAVRWALHRRRSYGVSSEDVWPIESAFRWKIRAEQETAGAEWSSEDVERSILAESITANDATTEPYEE